MRYRSLLDSSRGPDRQHDSARVYREYAAESASDPRESVLGSLAPRSLDVGGGYGAVHFDAATFVGV